MAGQSQDKNIRGPGRALGSAVYEPRGLVLGNIMLSITIVVTSFHTARTGWSGIVAVPSVTGQARQTAARLGPWGLFGEVAPGRAGAGGGRTDVTTFAYEAVTHYRMGLVGRVVSNQS